MMSKSLLSLLIVLVCAGTGVAGTLYPDLSSFLGVVQPGYYLENFNSLGTPSNPQGFSGNGYSYSASAPNGLYAGAWAGDGQLFGVNMAPDALTISFTSGNVTAVGGHFFVTDIVNNVLGGSVTLNFSDGTSTGVTSGSPVPFLGYSSSLPLTSLVISGPGEGYYVSMDDFYVGSSVPEPSTMSLFGAGILVLAGLRRYRRL